ncbi:hypothetical protein ACKWTF_006451 [Chironomus riparius]
MVQFKLPTKSTFFSSDVISHLQMADEIFKYAMKWARLCGGEIFDKNYKFTNKKLLFTVILLTLTSIINIYDIFLFKNDIVRCVFCLLSFSCEVQSFAKIYSFLWLHINFLNLRKQCEKFHEHFSSLTSSKMFERKFMIAAHVITILTILYICTFILLVLYPMIFYLIMNERILICGIELPFIDWKESWIGYAINLTHQMMCLFTFFCGSIFSLCVTICFITCGVCQFDVLKILLDELNELIVHNKDGNKYQEIQGNINFLAKTHANLIDFLQKMREIFAVYYFIEYIGLVFQKTVELFAISTVSDLSLIISIEKIINNSR